ncbi:hypothetical protein BV898_19077 [Hypsibius exemplaris]|uniref:Uncharacterized protein n=1 Tax=Hypsibius exemplaris TaxID=2072580 RepID=A0A9X6RNS0_HYPEX|nr:hypothetical protein BV898_19077 [Hypsibius exemplaris]
MVYGAVVIALTRHYAWKSIAVINNQLNGSGLMTRNSEHCRAPLEMLDLLPIFLAVSTTREQISRKGQRQIVSGSGRPSTTRTACASQKLTVYHLLYG